MYRLAPVPQLLNETAFTLPLLKSILLTDDSMEDTDYN